jgi:hypothetical protein
MYYQGKLTAMGFIPGGAETMFNSERDLTPTKDLGPNADALTNTEAVAMVLNIFNQK